MQKYDINDLRDRDAKANYYVTDKLDDSLLGVVWAWNDGTMTVQPTTPRATINEPGRMFKSNDRPSKRAVAKGLGISKDDERYLNIVRF